eukprot:GHVT01104515.1.p1 GENE.GHVT01104515.1~~GHVT01104515.1.p1  ORF type:complete len:468 (-),score=17.51 GHVT01104515.1:1102-2505(-)
MVEPVNEVPEILHGIPGIPSLILSTKGRIFADILIFCINSDRVKVGKNVAFLLDVDYAVADFLFEWLQKRILRAKVKIQTIGDTLQAYQLLPPLGMSSVDHDCMNLHETNSNFPVSRTQPSLNNDWFTRWASAAALKFRKLEEGNNESLPVRKISADEPPARDDGASLVLGNIWAKHHLGLIGKDPRYWRIGYRIYLRKDIKVDTTIFSPVQETKKDSIEKNGHGIVVNDSDLAAPSIASADKYTERRILLGIPEGSSELKPNRALPLNNNLDYLGYLSQAKGCYLGQELTNRSLVVLPLRRRLAIILPWSSQLESAWPPPYSMESVNRQGAFSPTQLNVPNYLLNVEKILRAHETEDGNGVPLSEKSSDLFLIGRSTYFPLSTPVGGVEELGDIVASSDSSVHLCILKARRGDAGVKSPQEYLSTIIALCAMETYVGQRGIDMNAEFIATACRRVLVRPVPYIVEA